jgi:hypothetical protein
VVAFSHTEFSRAGAFKMESAGLKLYRTEPCPRRWIIYYLHISKQDDVKSTDAVEVSPWDQ